MSECKFRAADGERLREREFPYKEYCVDGPCPHYTSITNADRIRSLSDEELAEFLGKVTAGGYGMCAPGHYDCTGKDSCAACWLDWLKQEAHDEPV